MMKQLKLTVLPFVAAVITLGQSPVASAAPVQVTESPRTTFVAPPNAHTFTSGFRGAPIPCLLCPPASIAAGWVSDIPLSLFSPYTIVVSGQHFTPDGRVEVVVPGGGVFFGRDLLDTVVTAAPDEPCRASRDCVNTPGTFTLVHDFTDEFARGLHCGDPLDVAATDLTPLERGDVAMAINISTIACVVS